MRKKILSALLAGTVIVSGSLTAFSSCGPKQNNDIAPQDKTKTQLYVGQEANGYGELWLEKIVAAFENWAADKSFQEGKKGVQIQISTRGFAGNAVIDTLPTSRANVVFGEEIYFYDFVSKGVLMDITEAITTPLTEFGETETIEQKMMISAPDLKEGLTGYDGNYYALPWWTGLQGLNYDIDLFNDKDLFIKKGGAPSEYLRSGDNVDAAVSGEFVAYKWGDQDDELAAGPDGKYGTYDDGLPATYEEFYVLCDQMKTKDIVPITWTGMYQYGNFIVGEMARDFDGYENSRMDLELSGTAYNLVESYSTNSDGSINWDSVQYMGGEEGMPITDKNGYLLAKTEGKLRALEFARTLVKKGYISENAFTQEFSHTAMQEYFLKGKYNSSFETTAMIAEGTWWYGQAAGVFDSMEAAGYENAGKTDRNLGFLPYPKADVEHIGDNPTFRSRKSAFCFVNANIKDEGLKEAALAFYRFCHTDEALKIFNSTTGGIRPFDFDYTEKEKEAIGAYPLSTHAINKVATIDHPYVANNIFMNNQSYFADAYYMTTANISGVGTGITNNFKTFKDYSKATASSFFDGISSYYTKAAWENRFSKWFK